MSKIDFVVQITLSVTIVISAIFTIAGVLVMQEATESPLVFPVSILFIVLSTTVVFLVELWR